MVAALTRNTRLLVGGAGWATELTEDYAELTIADTVNTVGSPAAGREWINKEMSSYDPRIEVPTLYLGEASNEVASRAEGMAFATSEGVGSDAAMWFAGGPAIWQGLPLSIPAGDVLVNNVTFLASGLWATGRAVEFSLSASATEAAIPFPVTNAMQTWWAITAITPAGTNRNVNVSDGTNTVATSIKGSVGVVRGSSLSGLTAGTHSGAKISASLSGSQTLAGVCFIGNEYEVPS